MKVHELISHLQKLNPEAEICQENNEYDFVRYFSVINYPNPVDAAKAGHERFHDWAENKNIACSKIEIVVFPEKITAHNNFNSSSIIDCHELRLK